VGDMCARCGLEHPDEGETCWIDLETRASGAAQNLVRRSISALFCDLVGSTELATELDPELLHDLYSEYYAMAQEAIASHGGVVEKFIGDGVVGVFGQQRPRTDDADRSVRAALDICAAAAGRRWPHVEADQFAVRIGVHTGEMALGATTDSGSLLAGDVIAVASRLQGYAESNMVIVSDAVRRGVLARLECAAIGALPLRGVAQPVLAWQVTAVHEAGRGGSPSPFLGREAELAALSAQIEHSRRSGSTRIARVTGPSGIGKSRLLRQFVEAAPGSQSTIPGSQSTMTSCRTTPSRSPYEPLLRALGALSPGDPGPAASGSTPLETAHLFSSWLRGCDLAGSVIVLDDFHEAPPEAREVVGLLPRLAHDLALLLVVVEEDDGAAERGATDHDPVVVPDARIELAGLPAALSRRLADELVEIELHDVDGAVLDDLVSLTEGNPLLIEQAAVLATEHTSGEYALPASAQAVVEQRIAALPAQLRPHLDWLAVLDEVEPGHLDSLLGESWAAPAQEALDLLCDLRLAYRTDQSPVTYGLSSRLVKRALVECQPGSLVSRRHLRYAQLLAGESTHPALIAQHLLAACHRPSGTRRGHALPPALSRAAVVFLAKAGESAVEHRHLSEAAFCLGDARRLAEEHGHPLAESAYWHLYDLALLNGDLDAAALLLDDLAVAAERPELVELERLFLDLQVHPERAADVQDSARRIRAAAPMLAQTTVLRCALRAGQAGMLLDDFAAASADLDEALRAAATLTTSPLIVIPAFAGAALASVHGPDPAPAAIARCEGLLARLAPGELLTGAAITLPLAVLTAMSDRPDRAARLLDQVDELAEDLDLAELTMFAAHFRAAVYEIGEQHSDALDAYRRALGSSTAGQDVSGAGAGYIRALIGLGRTDEAVEQSADWVFTGPSRTHFALADRGLAARVCLLRGDRVSALDLAHGAVAQAQASTSLSGAGTALLESCVVLRSLGQDGPADAAVRAAVAKLAEKGDLAGLRRVSRLTRRVP
jgi:class 3 adenylate cyclase/tetratricopeptide (TPR) repeat protein